MKRISKIFLIMMFAFLLVFCFSSIRTYAATNDLNIYLFWGDGCPHCAKEKEFLAKILPEHPSVKFNSYEVYHNESNIVLMERAADKLGVEASGVPFMIIGDKEFVGFADGTTDKEIESRIKYCTQNFCPDTIGSIFTRQDQSKIAENKNDSTNFSLLALGVVAIFAISMFSLKKMGKIK